MITSGHAANANQKSRYIIKNLKRLSLIKTEDRITYFGTLRPLDPQWNTLTTMTVCNKLQATHTMEAAKNEPGNKNYITTFLDQNRRIINWLERTWVIVELNTIYTYMRQKQIYNIHVHASEIDIQYTRTCVRNIYTISELTKN